MNERRIAPAAFQWLIFPVVLCAAVAWSMHMMANGTNAGIAVLVPQLANRDDLTVYAGYLDDEPVTCSLGFIDEGSISVFNVATLEEHRGNGYGAAMTMKAVLDGMGRGCDVAFLQATEMGFPLYERLGFETIFTYELWDSAPGELGLKGPPGPQRV